MKNHPAGLRFTDGVLLRKAPTRGIGVIYYRWTLSQARQACGLVLSSFLSEWLITSLTFDGQERIKHSLPAALFSELASHQGRWRPEWPSAKEIVLTLRRPSPTTIGMG